MSTIGREPRAAAAAAILALAAASAAVSGCAAPEYVERPGARAIAQAARADVVHAGGTFEAADGTRLFEQSWRPVGVTRAALVLVHGLKDHSSRYGLFGGMLAQRGVAVHAFDLRGHGDSEGRRVWIDDWTEYLDDLDRFLGRVRAAEPGKPVFLFGHSMGGAIATAYVLDRKPPLAGLILSAAALKPGEDISRFLIGVTKVFAAISPRLAVLELDVKLFSRDPDVVKAIETDPIVYQDKGPARTAAELLRALDRIEERMDEVELPLLALHGTADRITDPEGSRQLAARARSKEKTLKLYEGFYHDLLHEPDGVRVANDVVGWLEARLPKK